MDKGFDILWVKVDYDFCVIWLVEDMLCEEVDVKLM